MQARGIDPDDTLAATNYLLNRYLINAEAASVCIGLVGGTSVRKTPMVAFSRSRTPFRSRIMGTPTLSPPLTLTMACSVVLASERK